MALRQETKDGEYDPVHGDQRKTPIHMVLSVYAKSGAVVVHGTRGMEEVEEHITIGEAILRARALIEMSKGAFKYRDDRKEMIRISELMVNAIVKAKVQRDGMGFKSTRISMAQTSTDPTQPIMIDGKVVVDGFGAPVKKEPEIIVAKD